MFLAEATTWDVIAGISSVASSIIVAIIALVLFFTIRNFHQGKLKIKGGFIKNNNNDIVRVSFFNAGKYDVNLYSVGFIINKNTIECIDKMTEGKMKYVPCLSKNYCDFELSADECVELIENCVGSINEKKKVKVSYYALDTSGTMKVVKDRNLINLLKEALERKGNDPVSNTSKDKEEVEE